MLDVMEYIQIGMTSLYQEILLKGEKVKEKRNKIRDFVFHYIYLLKLRKERIYGWQELINHDEYTMIGFILDVSRKERDDLCRDIIYFF